MQSKRHEHQDIIDLVVRDFAAYLHLPAQERAAERKRLAGVMAEYGIEAEVTSAIADNAVRVANEVAERMAARALPEEGKAN